MRLWVCLAAAPLLGLLWSSLALVRVPPETPQVLAAIEHLVQPMVVVALMCLIQRKLSIGEMSTALRRALNLLIWALCLNALAILWVLRTGNVDVFSRWLPPGGNEVDSVWILSMEMGRYGGIFNQPFESGVCYSLALLAWCRIQLDHERPPFWEYGRLMLLLFGGVISISKVFILGGVPLFLLLSLTSKDYRKIMLNLRSGAVLAGLVLIISWQNLSDLWDGLSYFLRLFTPERGANLVALYTANRFGQEGTQVTSYYSEVWNSSPLFGFGFAPYAVLDNGLLWAFASGGIIGAGFFAGMIYKALSWARDLARKDSEQMFPLMMLVLMVAAALGAPSFTIDRGSTVFWTLYPLSTLTGLSRRRNTETILTPAILGGREA
jgi:hypothetical protein